MAARINPKYAVGVGLEMAAILFAVPSTRRAELDTILKEDRISRQSQKIRDAATLGGKAGELFVLVEGSEEAVKTAEEMFAKIGTKLPPAEHEQVLRRMKEEDESASTGMGLFFTE
ncbi:MAG TPA: hypothetical protein VMV28_00755 [Thermoplasmata archaeon]|nr:hypothetical protein [Thermoplasmata archaeon]